MRLWLTIIAAFIVQELVMMNATLFAAYKSGYNMLAVTLIFIGASIFDVSIGNALGRFVQRRFSGSKIVRYCEEKVRAFAGTLGQRGYRIVFTILGFISFNYVNAFLASWTNVPFKTFSKYLVLGDLLWYGAALLIVTGVSTYVDPVYAIYVVIGISVLVFAIISLFRRRFLGTFERSDEHYKPSFLHNR